VNLTRTPNFYRSTRALLASLPLLTALLLLMSAFDVNDRLPTWAGFLLGISLSFVTTQWARLVTRKPVRDAEVR
jgi:hypothetical protein